MAIVEEVEEGSDIKETVEKLKREGNEKFGVGEWTAAAEKYKEALDLCPPDLDSLRSVLFSNLAAVYIKQSEWKASAEAATEAIKANVPNEKALERRAFAFSNIPEKYQDAIQDYEKLKEQFPHRTQYLEKIEEINQKIAVRNEQMKSEMLGKLKELGDVCLRPFGLSTDSFQVTQNADGGYNISMKNAAQQ
ncbi:unnamed protein product [Angiostrongylus costaricensis]|uniref:TPR_REGION domain-containing protein n=1 Tax=Angiostrongylus costaricensis TaxID=334426 RepID=A0A0R3PX05_ANGCS|nr:unnamed protein product [Angiostrongylus costaricensis]